MMKNKLLSDETENTPDPAGKHAGEASATGKSVVYHRVTGASKGNNFRSPDFYIFLLLEKCSGTHTIDFIEYRQRDLQVHLSLPGQIHSWNAGAGTTGHQLLVSKQLAESPPFARLFSCMATNRFPVIDINTDTFDILSAEFSAIGKELETFPTWWDIITLRTQLIIALLNQLAEERVNKLITQKNITPVLMKFYNLVEQQYKEIRSVSGYAARLLVSSNHLSLLCKKHLGISAKDFISLRVLLEGKRLLLGSDITIKDIAFSLGFNDTASFSGYIKSKTGFTPKEFRNLRVISIT